ncbi:helix-turn-helix domain-containing protein [Aurantimonas coralicida]|uniref:helix-turn-helix domain-containing protein n=1 Tax=Aurantimonas coralicida TaxID=182270 RepID=UPI0009DC176A
MTLDDFLSDTNETQSAFAQRIGVPQGTVGRYVRGERIPRPLIMGRIIHATSGRVSASDFYPSPAVEHHNSASPSVSHTDRRGRPCPTEVRPSAAGKHPETIP